MTTVRFAGIRQIMNQNQECNKNRALVTKGENNSEMEKFIINGGKPLKGDIWVSGAKNSAVAILPAVLLLDVPCIIENVPDISDVKICLKILKGLGAEIRQLDEQGNTYWISCQNVKDHYVPYEEAKKGGIGGFFQGMGAGLIGAAVSPFTAGLRITNNLFVGIKNTALIFNPKLETERFRYPRTIQKAIRLNSYNEDEATIRAILDYLGGYDEHEIIYFKQFKYINPGLQNSISTLILTDKCVMIVYQATELVFKIELDLIKRVEVHKEKLAAYSSSNTRQRERQFKRRNNECTIRVSGFNPNYSAEKLGEIFSKAGQIIKVVLPNKTSAYIKFSQSVYTYDAYEMFNDKPIDGCILQVSILDNN